MLIELHSQTTTTPKIRAAIQVSDEPARVLAERYGTTEQTFTNGVSAIAWPIAAIRRASETSMPPYFGRHL